GSVNDGAGPARPAASGTPDRQRQTAGLRGPERRVRSICPRFIRPNWTGLRGRLLAARGSTAAAGSAGLRLGVTRTGVLGVAVAALAIGVLGEWSYARTGSHLPDLVRDAAVGWAFIATGVVATWRQPENRTGLLMVVGGFTWFLGNFEAVGVPVVFS